MGVVGMKSTSLRSMSKERDRAAEGGVIRRDALEAGAVLFGAGLGEDSTGVEDPSNEPLEKLVAYVELSHDSMLLVVFASHVEEVEE